MDRGTNGADVPRDNVVLFPKTIEYYQYELTKLLEGERYGEAIRLLRFLLACRVDDDRSREEWQSLLQWLEMMFPELTSMGLASMPAGLEGEEEVTESGLLRRSVQNKAKQQSDYAEKLLAMLDAGERSDKLQLALDQLAYLDHPRIDEALLGWLARETLHPLVQFKALQVLKLRGVKEQVKLMRGGEEVVLDIEDTPSGPDEFPWQIREMIARVQEISETTHPALSYFAQETWNEFLAFIYGTSTYAQLLRQEPGCVDVWASALHLMLLDKLFGGGNKEELLEMYGITSELEFQWEQAYRVMQQFAAVTFRRD